MYRLGDHQTRYQDFLQQAPESVESEAALLRVLIERAAQENRPALVNSLVATLAKVAATHQNAQIRAGELLERGLALRVFGAVGALVADILQERGIADWQDVVQELTARIPHRIEEVENERKALPSPQDANADLDN